MNLDFTPRLFIKVGCPWCIEAEEWLTAHQIPYQSIDVRTNPSAFEEMFKLSHQTKAPTLDWNGEILADFGIDELIPFLSTRIPTSSAAEVG